jgi:phosphoribosylaminoimidazole (AIR) synthetase
VGMILVCAEANASRIKTHIESANEVCYEIGRVTSGDQRVTLV